jgi:starch synthase
LLGLKRQILKEGVVMEVVLLSKEYPPYTYGGAGVHVDHLCRSLAKIDKGIHTVKVLCFGDQNSRDKNLVVHGIDPNVSLPIRDPQDRGVLDALLRNVFMVGSIPSTDILHCHTWYTLFAGCILKQILGAPLVITAHSLEPLRPWKEEQLGSAYRASIWLEKTAFENADGVIAVSQSMKRDVRQTYGLPLEKITVIPNGIDGRQYRPIKDRRVLKSYGIEPGKPYLLLVARLTRQKGIKHFLNAVRHLKPGVQVVFCASAPDTVEFKREVYDQVERIKAQTSCDIIWIAETVPRGDLIALYSQAAVFVCPSIYEPFGLINLEAMACGTPVVASAVGGIPEVVADGETGLLVPFRSVSPQNPEPERPEQFAKDLAEAVDKLLSSPKDLEEMGRAARKRVEEHFAWDVVAQETLAFYRKLINV